MTGYSVITESDIKICVRPSQSDIKDTHFDSSVS